jgi:3-deoxy-D-manno-octulosonic-acid transferase
MGIFVDSELWPNLLYYAAQKMPLINLNARLSDKSANLWGYFPWFARYIYSQFNLVLPCSQDDYVKISRFVDQNKLEFIGNLKLTSGSVPVNNETLRSVQDMFFKRFIVVLASTHPGEEKLVLQVMGKWLSNNPDIALVIAPRHPERREEIESVLSDLDISYCVRSKKQNFGPEYQVYLADTIGEMGAWYQLSRIVIMGGSFVPVGGHNIIEPAKLDNAVLIGPYYYNFRDAVKLLSDNGAIEVLNDVNALVQVLDNLYKNSEILEHQAYAAYKCSDAQEILRKAMAVIEKQLAPEDLI